jgi:predicted nuclease of predicted toxin-antitoxin system
VKIVVDMNLSPLWVNELRADGHEATHWSNIGDPSAPDTAIMQWARENGAVVFTHDLDYGALLFATGAKAPSVIQMRSEDTRPRTMRSLVLRALADAKEGLQAGALVTVDPRKQRIHLLPLRA